MGSAEPRFLFLAPRRTANKWEACVLGRVLSGSKATLQVAARAEEDRKELAVRWLG